MSTLTKNEKEGLEDVFLSIHTNQSKYEKIKFLSLLIMRKGSNLSTLKALKHAEHGYFKAKFSYFLSNLSLKKKNLRK